MATMYVRISRKRAVVIRIDRSANRATAPCAGGGSDFERLSKSGIERIVDRARRGWLTTVALDDIDKCDLEDRGPVCESVDAAWEWLLMA